jgi:hypothetical protein
MRVVQRNVKAPRGHIEKYPRPAQGVPIHYPPATMTLASQDGVPVRLASERDIVSMAQRAIRVLLVGLATDSTVFSNADFESKGGFTP